VLILPAHTIYASGTRPGDKLLISLPEEMDRDSGASSQSPAPQIGAATRGIGPSDRGTALIESALILPLLVVLMLNIVNFGMYLYAWVTLHNAARAVAEYQVYNGVVLGFPTAPSLSQMQCVLYQEVSSLPNRGMGNEGACTWSNVTLEICANANGSTTCQGNGTVFPISADSDSLYRIYAVRIGYTYQSLFSGGSSPYIILQPSTPIQATTYMRSME